MVAGDVGHVGAVPGVAEDEAEHFVMRGIPVPGFAQFPAIDDVAYEVEVLAAHAPEEIGEEIAARALGPEMDVGDEHAPETQRMLRGGAGRLARGERPDG